MVAGGQVCEPEGMEKDAWELAVRSIIDLFGVHFSGEDGDYAYGNKKPRNE